VGRFILLILAAAVLLVLAMRASGRGKDPGPE